jgi:Secretion system C-terminal sorting domain
MKISTRPFRTFLLLFLAVPFYSFATHNRAGEIQVDYVDNLTRRATIITYTKASSLPADRSQLGIRWGDGKMDTLSRSNGKGELLPGDIKKNIYIFTHTYEKYGNYTISMQDPNRNGGVLNVNFPQSDAVAFYFETYIVVSATLKNSTPRLLNPPIDKGVVGTPFKHIVNAFDADGDSVAYRLVVPLQDVNNPVPLYQFPDKIKPGSNNKATLNETTGEFIWNSPQQKGEYNMAIKIISYRNGVAIDSTVRDMQILIESTSVPEFLPEIVTEIPQLLEVKAGQEVFLVLKSKIPQSPENGNSVKLIKLTATSGAFELLNNKAEFNNNKGYQTALSDTFRWKVTEQYARKMPYMVVFKAEDNTFDSTGLVNFYVLQVKVNSLSSKVQELDNQSVKAYPNPALEAITFDFDGKNEPVLLDVFDVTGKNVFSTHVKNQNQFQLKKDEIGKGIFWVRTYFEKSNTLAVKKIVFE